MKTALISILIFTSILFCQNQTRFIDVHGVASQQIKADIIRFDIQIKTINENLENSKNANISIQSEIRQIFEKLSIQKSEWQISPLKFGEEFEFQGKPGIRVKVGYFTSASIKLGLTDFNKYYELVDALSKQEAIEIRSSGYGLKEYEKHHVATVKMAVAAAREKIEYIAETMGLKLGQILEISELKGNETYGLPFNTVRVSQDEMSTGAIEGEVSIERVVYMKMSILE